MATRTSGGKLHLVPGVGKIPLQDATLIEDPNEQLTQDDDGESSVCSLSSQSSGVSDSSNATSSGSGKNNFQGETMNLDFKIIVETKSGSPVTIHLMAPTIQEKQAWISDVSQCLDNVHFNNLLRSSISDTSSVTMPHFIKNDPRLFRDDVDIRFSRTLNSCKVPHIRCATPEHLLERLTDLRFLSIDFLNTFLLTYRVFTDGLSILEALKRVYYSPDVAPEQASDSRDSSAERSPEYISSPPPDLDSSGRHSPRRISTFSAFSASTGASLGDKQIGTLETVQEHEETEKAPQDVSSAQFRSCTQPRRSESLQPIKTVQFSREVLRRSLWLKIPHPCQPAKGRRGGRLFYKDVRNSTSQSITSSGFEAEVLRNDRTNTYDSHLAKSSGSQHWRWSFRRFEEEQRELEERRAREELLAGSTDIAIKRINENEEVQTSFSAPSSPFSPKKVVTIKTDDTSKFLTIPTNRHLTGTSEGQTDETAPDLSSFTPGSDTKNKSETSPPRRSSRQLSGELTSPKILRPRRSLPRRMSSLEEAPREKNLTKFESVTSGSDAEDEPESRSRFTSHSITSTASLLAVGSGSGAKGKGKKFSCESESGFGVFSALVSPRSSLHTMTPRSSFQIPDSPQHSVPKVGVVITSSRQSQRRSSSASAAAAFAVATAGCSNPRDIPQNRFPTIGEGRRASFKERPRQESIISTAATMRVLSVLRHWVSKHSQDFEGDSILRAQTIEFLEDLVCCSTLLPAEHKAASQLLRMLTKEEHLAPKIDLDALLAPPAVPSNENIETLSALDIAEQMTYIDHQIFLSIRREEFLKTAWMKPDKQLKAPHILAITKRFNEMARLVASEIIRSFNQNSRIAIIEKWVAVADICRCLRNFNGVLQVCAAFQNSSIFRLKKTWEKVSKATRQMLDKLQSLVSQDGRFRSLRDALHRCDPPCIPYLGMYLTDLSFIEEGTPNFTEDSLLNFSKMRMIAHVIREIRHFQQTPYNIEHNPKVTEYLLDTSLILTDDELYHMSLEFEPRRSTITQMSSNAPTAFMCATLPLS